MRETLWQKKREKKKNYLNSISNHMTAQGIVNVDTSREIGNIFLEKMVGQSVESFLYRSLSRQCHWVLNHLSRSEERLILQRLVSIGERFTVLQSLLMYLLYTHPPGLLEASALPVSAKKYTLADASWIVIGSEQVQQITDMQYILDGGALLHCIPW